MFFFFCLTSWVFSRIQNAKKSKRTFLKTSVFRNNDINSNLILRHNIQSQNRLQNQIKFNHHDGKDDDDDDDDDDDKDKDKTDLQRFIKFAKSTTGILTLCIASASLIIIILLIVLCCRRCGVCARCPCCACCRCCGSKNAPSPAEQYGQVILNNEDDIDYGLESI